MFSGESQKENTPAYLQAQRTGGNIVITWQGVGRLGAGTLVGMGLYFSHYLVSVNGVTQTTTEETITVTDPSGIVTISVQQVNTITGAGEAASITI